VSHAPCGVGAAPSSAAVPEAEAVAVQVACCCGDPAAVLSWTWCYLPFRTLNGRAAIVGSRAIDKRNEGWHSVSDRPLTTVRAAHWQHTRPVGALCVRGAHAHSANSATW
jgi:hypothetical protein